MSILKEPGKRSIQLEVEVPGTPEEVWQAIATGNGTTAWFTRAEIAAIRVAPSGVKVNNRDIIELQIHLADGRPKLGLLSERKDDELEWVAAVLRRTLGVGR